MRKIKLNPVTIVAFRKRTQYPDLEIALRFLMVRFRFAAALRETSEALEKAAELLLDEK